MINKKLKNDFEIFKIINYPNLDINILLWIMLLFGISTFITWFGFMTSLLLDENLMLITSFIIVGIWVMFFISLITIKLIQYCRFFKRIKKIKKLKEKFIK